MRTKIIYTMSLLDGIYNIENKIEDISDKIKFVSDLDVDIFCLKYYYWDEKQKKYLEKLLELAKSRNIGFSNYIDNHGYTFNIVKDYSLPFLMLDDTWNCSGLMISVINAGLKLVCNYTYEDDFLINTVSLFKYAVNKVRNIPTLVKLDFDGNLFKPTGKFDGFSSHCLGYHQELDAIEAGAAYIELNDKPLNQVTKLMKILNR